MRIPFQQTATCKVNREITSDFYFKLTQAIFNRTKLKYTHYHRTYGCFLKPTNLRLGKMLNSFIPELNIVASRQDSQTILHISGQPVMHIRIFMAIWIGYFLLHGIAFLVRAINANESIVPALIAFGLCVCSYLFFELVTKAYFRSVINAIEQEHS